TSVRASDGNQDSMKDQDNMNPDNTDDLNVGDAGSSAGEAGKAPEDEGHATSGRSEAGGPENAASEEARTGTESQDELSELRARVKELEEENSSLKDQYLRKQADFENFRKRMTKEKADAISYANQQLLQDVIQIIDDFERAIRSSEESRDFDAFHDGVSLIEKQFISMLERKWGLKRFDSEGEEFDPQKHEAVTTEELEGEEKSIVLEEYQKGYFLHDRVLRSAKVKVSMPKPSEN
ncbi:MAG: nucleotide exchange factor GrpE, partial [Spirochaetota bacterium]